MKKLKRNEKPGSNGAALRAALTKMEMLGKDGALKPYSYDIKPPTLLPGVVPEGTKAPVLAMDYNPCYGDNFFNGISNVTGFPGYPYLSQLTTRAEYRAFAAALSTELTREWIEFGSKDDTDDTDNKDKIKAIEEEFERLNVRNVIRQSCEHDCYYGRAQIFVDLAGQDRKTPLIIHKATVPKGSLKRIKTVEASWTTPTAYNVLDPAAPDFYNPSKWFMLGQEVHATRLLTIVTRPVADMLKPAFNFGGISLSQLAEPYVDNWLTTRQSVSDLIKNFSMTVLKTAMEQELQGDVTGQSLLDRVKLFLAHKNNRNMMLLDKETEELVQVNTPLSGLSELQAQSQEHMCAVGRMPAIVLTGLSPTGLNASSDGEMRVWYDWVAASQEADYYQPINTIFQLVQLSLFGEIDPNLTFRFIPLFQLTGKEEAEIRTADGATDCAYVTASVLAPEEVRGKLARDPKSGYIGLDVGKLPVPSAPPEDETPPDGLEREEDKPAPNVE
jgi:phage-related protein (TIGR01555 family)